MVAADCAKVYARRKPEAEPLHQVLSAHLLTFLAQTEQAHDGGLPAFVKKELLGYLDCGLLCRGAVKVYCPTCRHSLVVAFSCKGRGVCPSCGGRRMNDVAAHLVDRVVPDVPVRQWVLSLPHKYRFLIAKDGRLVQAVLGIFIAVVFGSLNRAAKAQGVEDPRPGAITAVQRLGDGLILNLHYHSLLLDGVYHRPDKDKPPVFQQLPPPTQEEVAQVALLVRKKVERLLDKRGLLDEGMDEGTKDEGLWEKLCAAAVWGRIAMGPKAGWRVRRLGGQPVLLPPGERHLCADADGFNVHANTHTGAGQRQELERLCRYILRPAVSEKRLSLTAQGDVIFKLKRTWSDGTNRLLFKPLEFIEKLAAIVPPPFRHLVTYHGVLSSHAAFRAEVVPAAAKPAQGAPETDGPKTELPPRPRRLPWADLLRRTFEIDVLKCVQCGGKMKVLAVITDPEEVVRLCENLGEPAEPPKVAPSRFAAQTNWDFAEPP
jgi:Putative transposase/Transposase zinc-binding domain